MKLTNEEFSFLVSCISNGFEFNRNSVEANEKSPKIEASSKSITFERFNEIVGYVYGLIENDQKNYI